ncbi:MAG: 30S ribosomal protein S20 [Myxococcales bacterium]
MANIASVIKRNRQAAKRRERNSAIRTTVRRVIKEARAAIAGKDPEARAKALREAMRIIDKASTKGVLHARNASRHISRLAKAAAAAAAAK